MQSGVDQVSVEDASGLPGDEVVTAPRKLGRYVLVEKLAEGGMAELFLGRQSGPEGFERQVVIKKLLPRFAGDRRYEQMLFEEARLAALLNHPNIVAVHEVGRGAGPDGVFIAMEHVEGCNLNRLERHLASRGRTLPLGMIVRIISDACAGLDYAHNVTDATGRVLNLIHRDVSPENILLTSSGIAKVVDFGIAKAASSRSQTRTGEVKGKLSYLAPEQIEGTPLDRRVDIWALGVTLYKMCCGAKPFSASSETATLAEILRGEPVAPHLLSPRIDRQLEQIILRTLEKDREKRYATAAELQQDLEGWAEQHGQVVSNSQAAAYFRDQFDEDVDLRHVSFTSLVQMETPPPEAELVEESATDPLSRRASRPPPPRTSPSRPPLMPSAGSPTASTVAPTTTERWPSRVPPPVPPEALVYSPTSARLGWKASLGIAAALPALIAGVLAVPARRAALGTVAPVPTVVAPKAASPSPNVAAPPAEAPAESAVATEASDEAPPASERFAALDLTNVAAPAAPRPKPPAAPGWLVIQVMPWAEVQVDGQPLGSTPLAPLSLSSGVHRVVLVNGELSGRRERTVQVRPGRETLVRESF